MMLRTVVACAVATRCRAYIVCLPFVSCFEVQDQTLKLQLEAYWCPPGGDDEFDWHGEDAQLRMGCVFRGLELVARIGAFGGDVRRAVEAGVLALNLPERETVEATIVQARNATCQAILSLTLQARKSLGAPFARGCDGETVAIMAERDDDDWESEWAGDRADEWELARDGEVRAEFRDSEVVEALGESPPKFWVADVSWRSRHVSRPVWKSTSASGAIGSVERRGTGIATLSSRRRVDGVEVDTKIQRTRRKI